MKRIHKTLCAASLLITISLLSGCDKSKPAQDLTKPTAGITITATEAPTVAPTLTSTKAPTSTPTSTPTPTPTSTPTPTFTCTPTPTNTPKPTSTPTPKPTSTPKPTPRPTSPPVAYQGSLDIPEDITNPIDKYEYLKAQLIRNSGYYDGIDNSNTKGWSFRRTTDHSQPRGYEQFPISGYNAVYVDKNVTNDDKVIYLTFDCGMPKPNADEIMDILKAHNAKANFFVTSLYLKSYMKTAKRMKEEGHAVCNHTVSHSKPVMTGGSVEEIAKEILDLSEYFYKGTGYELDPYFRVPSGLYTPRLLSIIRDAGYKTVFWSIAYMDYDSKNPPKPGYVTGHFKDNFHNGAIALMHNDCISNVNELDAVLTYLEGQGYRFGLLSELN